MIVKKQNKENLFGTRIELFILFFFILLLFSFTSSCSNSSQSSQGSRYDQEDLEKIYKLKPEDIQNTFRIVSRQVLPVVTEINVIEIITQQAPRFNFSPWDFFNDNQEDRGQQERQFRRQGLGSGVIVRETGNKVYVITNNHVVGNADEISVRLYDGREYEASIVGKDDRMDLALVVFESNEKFPIATLGDSDELQVGDWALAVGNPLGFESTVTAGIVSAIGREAENNSYISGYTDFIQTDAAINQGNSGGALCNIKGEVIGINTWIASSSGGNVGLGFAIPVNNVKKAIDSFIEKGKITYGWLGVSISDISDLVLPGVARDLKIEGKHGALVLNIYKGSPADKSGILPGDYITAINSTHVMDVNHLTRLVGNLPPGTTKDMTVVRYHNEKTLSVTFQARKDEEELNRDTNLWPGFVMVSLTQQIRDRITIPSNVNGVITASIIEGTSAQVAGLREGDVITKINNSPVRTVMDFYRELNENTGKEITFTIFRQGTEIRIGITR